ncbi:putative prepilin-type cleavage/methylation domain-containing protein [Paenibacillus sp. 598K]|uniref:prepilin-type N-terminal cleavage/methylation domain-containing protein n=1 Tax=Paenibacillus sp. 598K TaxID=1117987 RepID=UPI000FF984A3|nr:prepilin-type N-terminal cleavage/methylation domain-containing protein [Paenibacillus sp. 598K]GBF73377.1 putative prepilin-type cleavage/methylation domain-containing protein [Paenibacillus sp. 598K]
MIRGNSRGVTLIEVLAALSLTVLVLGTLLYLVNQTHSSAAQLQSRESALQQSRDIVQHLVSSARNGMNASQNAPSELWLHGEHGDYVHYAWDRTTGDFTVEQQLLDDQGVLGSPSRHLFSSQVADTSIVVTAPDPGSPNGSRIEITLVMALPGNQQHTTSTVVYTTDGL